MLLPIERGKRTCSALLRVCPLALFALPLLLASARARPAASGEVAAQQSDSPAPPATKQILEQDPRALVELSRYEIDCSDLAAKQTASGAGGHCFELAITNLADVAMSAWGVVVERDSKGSPATADRGARSEDCVIIPRTPQIEPGATRRVRLGNPDRVVFKAIVYRDGSSVGDPDFVRLMVENRGRVYDRIVEAIQKLRAAIAAGTTPTQLNIEFRELARQDVPHAPQPGEFLLPTPAVFATVSMSLERITASMGDPDRDTTAMNRLISQLLDDARRIAASKPPIANHPLNPGEPR